MTGAIALSSRMLMDLYFGDLRLPEISDTGAYTAAFLRSTFYPVLLSLKFAQTVPVVLLGSAAFIFYEAEETTDSRWARFCPDRRQSPILVYLVWLALLFQSFQRRRWKTLVSAAGSRRRAHSNCIGVGSVMPSLNIGHSGQQSASALIDARNGRRRSQPVSGCETFSGFNLFHPLPE